METPKNGRNVRMTRVAVQALDALMQCYDVTDYPANGQTSQDKAIDALYWWLVSEESALVWYPASTPLAYLVQTNDGGLSHSAVIDMPINATRWCIVPEDAPGSWYPSTTPVTYLIDCWRSAFRERECMFKLCLHRVPAYATCWRHVDSVEATPMPTGASGQPGGWRVLSGVGSASAQPVAWQWTACDGDRGGYTRTTTALPEGRMPLWLKDLQHHGLVRNVVPLYNYPVREVDVP